MFLLECTQDPALEASIKDSWHGDFAFWHMLMVYSCRYLPAIGRFLIVVTFLEDALRIITQWSDQLLYLHDYRHSMSNLLLTKLC